MKKRYKNPRDRRPASQRVCLIALWLQMGFGVAVTLDFIAGIGHGVLAGLLLVMLFMWGVGKDNRKLRLTARVLVGVAYAFAGILLLPALAGSYTQEDLVKEFLPNLVLNSLPVLLWLSPMVGLMSFLRGRYDRFVACFTQAWIVADVALALTVAAVDTQARVLFGISAMRFILVLLVGFATVTVGLCTFLRPRREKVVEGTTLSL